MKFQHWFWWWVTPSQQKNISKVIVECKILDRTHLILDILHKEQRFVCQNPSRVGTMPILTTKAWMWTHLERRGIGMRGPGKQKLKLTDVLYVIEFLLKDKSKDWQTNGYTVIVGLWFVWLWWVYQCKINFNECHREKWCFFVENKLFATLDTTVRKVVIKTCLLLSR
jgi:GTP-binding protein HflX